MTRRVSERPNQPPSEGQNSAPDQVFAPSSPFALQHPLPDNSAQRPQTGRGRRSQTTALHQDGYYVRATPPQGSVRDVAIDATLRAAALRLAGAGEKVVARTQITASDLRVKVRQTRTGNLILFVVDASGSMAARKRMVSVKGAILSLLLDAYQKRDRVGLITFRGERAQLLVPPTNSVELAERQLRQLPTGGRTPLAAGLQLAEKVLANYQLQNSGLAPLLVLVTDGRANEGQKAHLHQTALGLSRKGVPGLVLDSEQGYVRLGLAREIAGWLAAEYLPLDYLHSNTIAKRVRQKLVNR